MIILVFLYVTKLHTISKSFHTYRYSPLFTLHYFTFMKDLNFRICFHWPKEIQRGLSFFLKKKTDKRQKQHSAFVLQWAFIEAAHSVCVAKLSNMVSYFKFSTQLSQKMMNFNLQHQDRETQKSYLPALMDSDNDDMLTDDPLPLSLLHFSCTSHDP